MTKRDKILLQQSELRTELSGQLDTDIEKRGENFTDTIGKLTKELQATEIELRAAIAIEGTDPEPLETRSDGADREKRQLLGKASLSNFIRSAVSGKSITGAEAEASDAFNCPGLCPLELFGMERRSEMDNLETRAITPSPSTTGVMLSPTVPALFDSSIAGYFGH